jgi:hypothetical protein
MDSRRQHEDPTTTTAALDFIRFCHRRRRAGWPQLYDEMAAVASRGLYHGWGFAELAEHGIAFGLAEMPRLAGLVAEVAREDQERLARTPGVAILSIPRAAEHDEPSEDAQRAPIFLGAAR